MDPQNLIVSLIVLTCGAYAAWTLMPAALRRPLATRLLALPGLRQRTWLLRAAKPASGCGCDGCDAGAQTPHPPGAPQRIMIVRRPKGR